MHVRVTSAISKTINMFTIRLFFIVVLTIVGDGKHNQERMTQRVLQTVSVIRLLIITAITETTECRSVYICV